MPDEPRVEPPGGDELPPETVDRPRVFLGPQRDKLREGFLEMAFEDVVMRAFPLRANLNRLQTFCDRYLKMDVPSEMARFEPMAPYVFLIVINYGRMGEAASNLGWVSQNEIMFGVPILGEWNENGTKINSWAVVSPFIFVDNAWSIAAGREVYGWPKMPIWFEPGLSSWLRDPRAPHRLMTLKTLAVSDFYQGSETEAQTLLEIEQDSPNVFGQVPTNFDYLLNPLIRLPKTVADSLAATPDFLQSVGRIFKAGRESDIAGLVSQIFSGLTGSGADIHGNTINLKQFRASDPGAACYQALVNSRMNLKRFNAGGLLGSVDLLRGDPSAGFSVFVHRLPAYSIIESLGLEVEREHDRRGVSVAELKPLMPFWISCDMSYKYGNRICWRSSDQPWRAWGVDDPVRDAPPPKIADDSADPAADKLTEFNTTLGSVIEATQGPFDFYDASIRVLPIEAKSEELLKLFPDLGHLDVPVQIASRKAPLRDMARAEAIDPATDDGYDAWVLLMVTSYGEMSSSVNDIGWWAKNEVSLVIPVEFGGVAWLAWPYTFSDSPVAVTEGREVLGLPTEYARITQGADPWLERGGHAKDRQLLSVNLMDYPAEGVGQKAVEQRILQINRSEGAPTNPFQGVVQSFKDSEFFARYRRLGLCIPNMSIKEFRDEEKPDQPCYQAMVGFDRELGDWAPTEGKKPGPKLDVEALGGTYTVRLKSTPGFPIVEKLGLKHRMARPEGGSPYAVCDVVEPFAIRANIRAQLSSDMVHRRIDTLGWEPVARAEGDDDYLKAKLKERDEFGADIAARRASDATPQLKDVQEDLHDLTDRARDLREPPD